MNFPNFNQQPTLVMPVIVQPSQAKSTSPNISIAGIFVTLMIIGITLGCFIRYRKCKNDRQQQALEIIREIEASNKIQKETTEREQNLSLQMKKQIETLEKIWNKTP